MSNDEAAFFELNVHCVEMVFDLLSVDDLCAISRTCKYMQTLASDYFKWKHHDYTVEIDFPMSLNPTRGARYRQSIKSCMISVTDTKVMECFGDHVKRWYLYTHKDWPNFRLRWLYVRLPYAVHLSSKKLLFPFKAVDFIRFKRATAGNRDSYVSMLAL